MKKLILTLALIFMTSPAMADDTGRTVDYADGEAALEGYWVPPATTCVKDKPAPVVIIAHQWMGITDHERDRAKRLSEQCYNAFALDLYGKGVRPRDSEEAGKLATIYKNDPALARSRVTAALNFVKTQPGVDSDHIAIIGFCLGGGMALELARTGADIDAAVSFHGTLTTKDPITHSGIIKAPIYVYHGVDDPFVPVADVKTFQKEMDRAKANYKISLYSGAVHSFTQKEAGNDPSKGAAYNAAADKKSWESALNFLRESFAR